MAKTKNAQPEVRSRITDAFSVFARSTSTVLGSAWAFTVALLVIVIWAVTGPAFHFSDTWQLIINTGTTIVTFLMVFLIQNTQNRDAKAAHLKLDEIIRALQRGSEATWWIWKRCRTRIWRNCRPNLVACGKRPLRPLKKVGENEVVNPGGR